MKRKEKKKRKEECGGIKLTLREEMTSADVIKCYRTTLKNKK